MPRGYLQDYPDLSIGESVFYLLNHPLTWVHRRVETITFLSAEAVRRQISIDLSAPSEHVETPLPLALLVKQPLVNFDVWNQDGRRCPVLTKNENGLVAWSLLCFVAQDVLAPESLHLEIQQDLRAFAMADAIESTDLLQHFNSKDKGEKVEIDQRKILLESAFFIQVAKDLMENFLLLLPPLETSKRTIIKFAYDDRLVPPEKRWDRLTQQLGWRYTSFDFLVPAIGEGDSYHVEIEVPPELAVDEAIFFVERDEEAVASSGRLVGQRAHLYGEGHQPDAYGMASIWIKQPRPGLLRLSVLSSVISAAALTFYFINLAELEPSLTASLLLTIPGLVSLFVARPREHALATYYFFGIRLTVGFSAVLAYAAALLLTVGPEAQRLVETWRILMFLSWACVIILVISYFSLEPFIDGWYRLRTALSRKEDA